MTDTLPAVPDRPAEKDLEDWIARVAETLPRDEFTVPKERARDFQLLYGFCIQAARFASSYLVLRDQGFQREAAALARCSFEHVITAHWCYFTLGGIDRLAVDVNRDFLGYYTFMSEYLDNEQLRVEAEAHGAPDGTGLPTFTQMMWDLDGGGFLRTSYRNLSLSVHPTHLTVSTYLEATDEGTSLRHEPKEGIQYPTLYVAAISSMLALSLLEYIVDPTGAKAMLEDDSNRLQLPTYLDDNLPDEKKRWK